MCVCVCKREIKNVRNIKKLESKSKVVDEDSCKVEDKTIKKNCKREKICACFE